MARTQKNKTKLEILINPVENRFNAVESEVEEEAMMHLIYSDVKSVIRGGIVGGMAGYILSGGDEHYTLYSSIIGALTDMVQNTLQFLNLHSMKRENPQRYQEIKNKSLIN